MGVSALHPLPNVQCRRDTEHFPLCSLHLSRYFFDLDGDKRRKGNRARFFNSDILFSFDLYFLGLSAGYFDVFPERGDQPSRPFSARYNISLHRGTPSNLRMEGKNEAQELNLLYSVLIFLFYIPIQTGFLDLFQVGGIKPDPGLS